MRRFKFLAGTTFSILALFIILALGLNHRAPKLETNKITAEILQKNKALKEQHDLILVELNKAVGRYFKKAINSGEIVGAGVSIVHGDSILFSEGFGKRRVNTGEKVDGETVFRLGSLSKGFTGVLAADLKNENKFDWNDKVSDYLTQFQLGDATNSDKIKLSHILSHTSGTPYHSFTNLVEAGLPLEKIAGRFNEVKPISGPGEMYSYQNAMFALSGEIMEKVTGKHISTLLQDRFFVPLGMHSASTDYETLIKRKNIAKPHSKRRKYWKSRSLTNSYDNAIAAGGINASALDMAKWMRFLLGHNAEVMNASAIAEAFEPQIEINIGRKYYKRWPDHKTSYYAFGWRIHKFEDQSTQKETTMWHHGGSVNSFRNEIALYPESDLGICVLLNSNSRIARTVIPDLHQIVKRVYENTSPKVTKTPAETVANSFE